MSVCLFLFQTGMAQPILLNSAEELNAALQKAKPGDSLLLNKGEWKDVALTIGTSGTKEKPLVIAAAVPGSVQFTGKSFIRLGADHVVIAGIHFTNGYAPGRAIIEFRKTDKELANYCRVTQCVFENYTHPGRMENDSWLVLWGKHNRIDHCVIGNKLNGGTTLIVELNDERSQENFHQIDSNYFKERQPLGSNGGEIIRVGVSRYSLTSGKTDIHHNYFERCNGEVEIISIKSCNNRITNNTFVECEGGLVLRHGSNNTVLNNIFIGNNKPHTGGVRVINPGHTVANNLFIELAGERFYGAFTVLNGVPNSAINRYHQVTDVNIHHNTFIDCKTILFGAGKDEERTAPPKRVSFHDNLIAAAHAPLYEDANNDGGILFSNNGYVAPAVKNAPKGFAAAATKQVAVQYGSRQFKIPTGKAGASLAELSWMNAANTGARWFRGNKSTIAAPGVHQLPAAQSERLPQMVAAAAPGDIIVLTDTGFYRLQQPIVINKALIIKAGNDLTAKPTLVNRSSQSVPAFFILANGGSLSVENLAFNCAWDNHGEVRAAITTASESMSNHYILKVKGCEFFNLGEAGYTVIKGTKSTFADSVLIENCLFRNNAGQAIAFADEKDDKGIYGVQYLLIRNCVFANLLSGAINVYRGGNDESTTGPEVIIDHCTFHNVENRMQGVVVKLLGVQQARITNSVFNKSGAGGRAIWFEEMLWDKLLVDYCNFYNSGRVSAFFNKALGKHIYATRPVFTDPEQNNYKLASTTGLVANDKKPLGAY